MIVHPESENDKPASGKDTSPPNPFDVIRRILHSSLTPGAVRLLLEIADRAGHGRGQCWASVEKMARLIGMSPGQARRILEALEADGWVVSQRSGKTKFSRKIMTLGPRCIDGPTGDDQPTRQRVAKTDDAPTRQREPKLSASAKPTCAPALSQLRAGAHQTSSLTSAITSSSNEDAAETTDDVRCAPSEEKTPETSTRSHAAVPDATADDLLDVVKRCTRLPGSLSEAIRNSGDLATRIKGDWSGLMSAAMRLDQKIREGDAPPAKKILKPLEYLLGVFREINGPDFPPGERDGLAAKVQRLRDPAYARRDETTQAPQPTCDDISEADFRLFYVSNWIRGLEAKGTPLHEIKPQILAHIENQGAKNCLMPGQIENRKKWAAVEIDLYVNPRSRPPVFIDAPAGKVVSQ